MKLTITRKVGSILFLFTLGALSSLAAFHAFLVTTMPDGAFINLAGKHRMLSQQLLAWTTMVHGGQDEDRGKLREQVGTFDQALATLEAGGKFEEIEIPPAPREVLDEIADLRARWTALKPSFVVVAEKPAQDPASIEAYAHLRRDVPILTKTAEQVVAAIDLRLRRRQEAMLRFLGFVAALDLVLLAAGIWFTRRYIARPVLQVEEAALRIRRGDYSLKLAVETNDELAALARMFNSMMDDVVRLLARLEEEKAAAQAHEKRFRDLVEGLDAIVWEATVSSAPEATESPPDVRFTFVSKQAEKILHYPVEQWLTVQDFCKQIVHPEDREKVVATCGIVVREGTSGHVEHRAVSADGDVVWLNSVLHAIPGAPGRPVRIRGLMVNVTERMKVRETLRENEEEHIRLVTAVEQAGDGIVVTDASGLIRFVNPAFERLTGYSREEVLGRNPRFLKSGKHDPAFYEDLWKTILGGEVWNGRFVNKRKDGTLYEEHATIAPIRDPGSRITSFVAVLHDLTEQNKLEEQLRQAQKMEAVGRLAGGVAHDFNNILTAILGYSDLLLGRFEEGHEIRGQLLEIKKAGVRASTLTRQLLALSRKQVLEPKIVDMNAVVGDTEKMLRRLIGEDIDLVTVRAEGLWPVKIDPGQMEQVILNLAVNARDAMPKGGRLAIETANVALDAEYASGRPDVRPGPHVMLSVSDTGCGIPDEVKAHIFEPFFTTKGVGKGTGLGLSTVHGIVKQSGGHIWLYSEVDKGTVFKIFLPRAAGVEAGAPAGRRKTGPIPQRGTETVLIVEDEPDVRGLVRRILLSAGYRVIEAGGGPEALSLVEKHEGEIHLLLTDTIMPGMSGPEVARRVAERRPRIKVLYTSGYTDDMIGHHGVLDPGVAFIQKPFTVQDLTVKVREVLDRPRDPDSP